MKQKHLLKSLLLLLAMMVGSSVWADTVTDELTQSWTGVSGTNYSNWTGKTATSNAVYAGNSAGGNSSIQLRSNNNNSGVVTTTSGGKVKKIIVTWNSNTTSDRTLNVYGKNTAFSAATDLYDSSKQGTLLGTIVYGTSTELTIPGDYEYVGFRSAGGALYLDEVKIEWEIVNEDLEESDLTLTETATLSFDLYGNNEAKTISYTTSSTGEVTVSENEFVEAEVDAEKKTITVTPKKKTNGEQTIIVNQASDDTYAAGTATFNVIIDDSTPYEQPTTIEIIPNYTFWGQTAQFSGSTYDNLSGSQDNVSLEWSRGTGSMYANQTAMRFYKDNELTFTAPTGYLINSIELEVSGTYGDLSFSPDGYDSESLTWIGESETVTMSRPSNASSYATISKYTITLEQIEPKVLASIALSGEYLTTFHVGDEFSHEGVVVTATYENGKSADVTADATFSTPDMTSAGTKTITVSYTEGEVTKTATYDITVNVPATLTSIALSGTYPIQFQQGDEFSSEGIIVTANYDDNTSEDVTAEATFAGYDMSTLGEQTVTVTYEGKTATYTITIVEKKGTADNPYTVAEARAAIDAGTGVTGVYATGIVSEIVTAYSSQYGNISYNISEDGTTTADQLQAFRGKGKDGANFTSEDDIQVGDVVVIYGNLTKYGDTYEFAANNQLVSLDRPASTTPSITVADAMVSVDAGEHDGTLDITYENLSITDMEDFDIQYYDAEGEETSEPDWIEVLVAEQDPEVGEGYVVSYYMAENEGEARTAYFKVYALDEDANEVYSNLVTITQEAYVAPEAGAAVTFDFSENNFDLPEGSSNKTVDAVDYTDGNYTINLEGSAGEGYYWNASGYLIMGKVGASLTLPAFNLNVSKIKVYGRSGASGKVTFNIFVDENAVSTEATSSVEDHEFVIDDDYQAAGTIYTIKVTNAYNAQISKIEIFGYVNVKVTAAGYATYCSENALDFSAVEGLTAYKATITDNKVSFTEVEQVPALQGVLLKGTQGTYEVPVIASAAELEDNAFIGVTKETKVEEKGIFVLMNPEGGQGVGFYKTTADYFTVGANTAYLPATAGARSFIGFDFDNTTTAIEGVATVESHDGEVYNLQGQRVVKAQKGLYIINGKKVVLK